MVLTAWTEVHENILKECRAKLFAYMWLQNMSSYFYITCYNWLAYLVIVFSAFASATMFSFNSQESNCGTSTFGISTNVIQYTIGSISLLSAVLTGIIRQMRPGELYQQHCNTAKKYSIIIRAIDGTLLLTRDLRPDPIFFIEKTGQEVDNMIKNQNDPPHHVIKRFEKIYGPIERILYGEDIVELWKIRYNTNRLEKKILKRDLSMHLYNNFAPKKNKNNGESSELQQQNPL